MLFKTIPAIILSLAPLDLGASPLLNQPSTSTESIDQVLDLLEKKMIEPAEKKPEFDSEKKEDEINITRRYKFSTPEKIEAQSTEKSKLGELKNKAQAIASKVDSIEANINKLKSDLIDSTKHDAFVEIYSSFNAPDVLLRSIKITLNDLVLVDLIDGTTTWNFGDSMPIFFGPIRSGSHRLQVTARLSSPSDHLHFASDYRIELNKYFEIHIPLGSGNHKFTIEISAPSRDEKPTLNLKDS